MKAVSVKVLLAVMTVGFLLIWLTKLVFSEPADYRRWSVEFYLLTPPVMMSASSFCRDSARFRYSISDGPSPTTVVMHCDFDTALVSARLAQTGFILSDNGTWSLETGEIKTLVQFTKGKFLDDQRASSEMVVLEFCCD